MPKQKKLTDIEIFYLEGNCLKFSLEEMAEKLNVNKENIRDFYEKTKIKKNLSFQTYSGTVAMTESQSSKDDNSNNQEYNKAFMEKYKNNIHKI